MVTACCPKRYCMTIVSEVEKSNVDHRFFLGCTLSSDTRLPGWQRVLLSLPWNATVICGLFPGNRRTAFEFQGYWS